jgi:hypothetical protein
MARLGTFRLPEDGSVTTLREIAILLGDASSVVLRTGTERNWAPEVGSTADSEQADGVNPGYTYPWLLTVAACEHLTSASRLIGFERPQLWSCLPLLRSGMDSAIRAWWVLDPSADANHRRARGYELLRLAVAETQGIPGYEGHADDWRRLRTRMNDDGIPIYPTGKEGPVNKVADLPSLSSQDLYSEFFEDQALASPVHRWLSGVGHGDVWVLSELAGIEAGSSDRRRVTPQQEEPYVALGASFSIDVVLTTFHRWCELHGWRDHLEPATKDLLSHARTIGASTIA